MKPFHISSTLLAWIACATLTGPLAFSQDSSIVTEVVGLSITKPETEKKENSFGGSAVLGRPAGVEIHLRIHDPKSFFTSVLDAEEGSKTAPVLKSADDQVLQQDGFSGGFGFAANISDDGHTVILPLRASQLPPKGSDQIKVVGTIKFNVGSDTKTESVDFVPKADTKLKLGATEVKISEVEEDPFGQKGLRITFATNKPMDNIQSIKFLDGKDEIESGQEGKSSFGFGQEMTYSITYMLKAKPTTVTAQVSYFGATKQVEVPLNLSVGLSLDAK